MTPPTDRAATVPTASRPWSQVPRAGLVDAVAAEWIRLRSVRAPWALLACVIGALPVLAAVVGATGSVMPDDTVLGASIVGGGTLAMLAAAGLGAVTVTAEHRSGGIAAAWAGTPRRGVLMAAQAIVVSVVCMAVALPAAGMACVVGSLTLDTAEFANLRPGEPWPALLGIALVVGCSGVIGVALGTILRHTGAALAAVGALVLLPGMLAPVLGPLHDPVAGLSLTGILATTSQSSDAVGGTVGSWGAWPSLLLLLIGCAVLLGVAALAARRDL